VSDDEDRTYNWRVTSRGKGQVTLDYGDELSELAEQVGDTLVTHTIGNALIKIGTHLLNSRVVSDDDDEDGDDW
jgi:hypothetical protein